jgi:hypothetical protein
VNSAYRQSSGTFMAGRLLSQPGSDPWRAKLVSLFLLRMRPDFQGVALIAPIAPIASSDGRQNVTLFGCGVVSIPWRDPPPTALQVFS